MGSVFGLSGKPSFCCTYASSAFRAAALRSVLVGDVDRFGITMFEEVKGKRADPCGSALVRDLIDANDVIAVGFATWLVFDEYGL